MPNLERTHRHLPAYLILLAILIVVGTLAYLLQYYSALPSAADYTAARQDAQQIVTYTGSGFHPESLSITKGEIVRFTNNAATPVRISVDHAQSSQLMQGQYWEHTFTNAGNFQYESTGGSSGTASVQ